MVYAKPSIVETYMTETGGSSTQVVHVYSAVTQSLDQGVAPMIAIPFGAQPAAPVQTSAVPPLATSITTPPAFLTQLNQAAPSILILGSNNITRNAPPITVSGTSIFFGSNGLVLGSTTLDLPNVCGNQQSPLTTLGQTLIPDSTGFSIASTTLRPYGPAVTISGTPVSLNPSALIIGSSTIPFLSAPQHSQSPATASVLTIAGYAVTAAPTGFAIDGTTLMPGASGVTISGTLVSLGTAADLVVGTSLLKLPTPSSSGAATENSTLSLSATATTPSISNGTPGATAPSTRVESGTNKDQNFPVVLITLLICLIISV